ncbi:MAG: NAD(P)H-hydrate dehydratase [Bdellovibrionaceae bacterium]|nr:NAD(P)H-hydrate dehydratase [Pseudobdellovibrionaceae bacterium]
MIRLANAQEAANIDGQTQASGVSALHLMNQAGLKAALLFTKLFPHKKCSIVFMIGPGNNGGDGVVMCRELNKRGYKQTKLYLATTPKSDLLKTQLAQISPSQILPLETDSDLPPADIYIDALFGIGLSKPLTGIYEKMVTALNTSTKTIISLDIPSGLSANTGLALDKAVRAHHTFTFGVRKLGMFIEQGSEHSGRIHVLDIGFPKSIVQANCNTYFIFTRKDFLRLLPARQTAGNKAHYGHVQILGGHPGTWGAAVLTAKAAYKNGAGYVSIPCDQPYFTDLPEVLIKDKIDFADKYTFAAGPGWSVGEKQKEILKKLAQKKLDRVILDADALNTIAKYHLHTLIRPEWVLTPHPLELARLLAPTTKEDIQNDRPSYALLSSKKWGCTIVVKGFRTLVAYKDKVFVIPTGNNALSKAGSGDVLTGIISAFRAQGLTGIQAALCGAYLHGAVADNWIKTHDPRGLNPSDIIHLLPQTLKKLQE